jgi:hypothetical protein
MDPEQSLKHSSTSSRSISTRSFFARSIVSKETKVEEQNDTPKGPLGLTTIYEPSEVAVVDLVFVHGLNGGSYSTWSKNGDPSLFWPKEWLPSDYAFRDVRIHTFGYRSGINRESILNVQDFARSLLAAVMDAPTIPRGDTVSISCLSVPCLGDEYRGICISNGLRHA